MQNNFIYIYVIIDIYVIKCKYILNDKHHIQDDGRTGNEIRGE